MQNHDLFLMTSCTSLHAGTGRSDFSIIDHQVQRDYRGFPTIFKSSMKGALREHCTYSDMKEEEKAHIFGGNYAQNQRLLDLVDSMAKANSSWDGDTLEGIKKELKGMTNRQTTAGRFSFYDALLFSIPVRSNARPYFNVTCPQILKDFYKGISFFRNEELADNKIEMELKTLIDDLGAKENVVLFDGDPPSGTSGNSKNHETIFLEEFSISAEKQLLNSDAYPLLSEWTEKNLVVVSDTDFLTLTNNHHLPIIPRNDIQNGLSNNLWYEQVLSAETRFYSFIGYPEKSNAMANSLEEAIHHKVVSIGANQSVGYGRCWFEKIQLDK